MRIKIIGDNPCARATRHLLRVAGFAVTEFLPADAAGAVPLAGYAITIDLAPALHSPDPHLRPGPPPHDHPTAAAEEAPEAHSGSHLGAPRGASSPAFVAKRGTTAGKLAETSPEKSVSAVISPQADMSAVAPANFRSGGGIHFDSVESALEAAVLRHVTQLSAAPVIVDRPGGVVHSERELRIVAPNTGDAKADEAAALAIEFGVLRGLLDLCGPTAEESAAGRRGKRSRKKWWPFGALLLAGALGATALTNADGVLPRLETNRLKSVLLAAPCRTGSLYSEPLRGAGCAGFAVPSRGIGLAAQTNAEGVLPLLETDRLKSVLLGAAKFAQPRVAVLLAAQEQVVTGQGGIKITDGTNFLALDPCQAQAKSYASINQTANAQLAAGATSKKIYVCSIHVVVAAATNVALVEGTGSVCASGTAGVNGLGGATAATGWNFASNGGIALGNGDSSVGAEGTSGDNLCLFNSGSGQVSGGISYVVQ
jgi:hypothetical protein